MAVTRTRKTAIPKNVSGPVQEKPDPRTRLPFRIFALVFLGALVVRLIYFAQVHHCTLFQSPTIDARDYYNLAVSFARGDLLAPDGRVYWQPPFYPLVLSIWMKILGIGVIRMKLMQFAVGSLNCALITVLGTKVFNRKIGIVAGIAAALYGPMIYFDGELLTPTVQTFFILCTILLTFAAVEKRSLPLSAVAGYIFGLAIVTRPDVSVFLPVMLFWVIFSLKNQIRLRRLVGMCGLLIFCAALPIAPITARNMLFTGERVLISTNGGINYYIGNNENARKTEEIRPGPDWDAFIEQPRSANPGASASEQDEWFLHKAVEFIQSHPGKFIWLQVCKLGEYFTAVERRRNHDLYFYRSYSPLYSVLIFKLGGFALPFGIVFPLTVFGMLRTRWNPRLKLLLWFLITQCLVTAAFFVSARYRIIAIPVSLLFAAFGAFEFVRVTRDRCWKQVAAPIIIATVALIFTNLNIYQFDTDQRQIDAETHYFMGSIHQYRRESEAACAEFKKSISLNPAYQQSHLYYAMELGGMGERTEAEKEIARALELYPTSRSTNRIAGDTLMRVGNLWGALRCYRTATSDLPWSCDRLVRLGEEAMKRKDYVLFYRAYEGIANQRPDMLEARTRADSIRQKILVASHQLLNPKEVHAMEDYLKPLPNPMP